MEEEFMTIYIEDVDGIYFAYKSKSDKYAGSKLTEAKLTKRVADELWFATSLFNDSQALLCDIYNA